MFRRLTAMPLLLVMLSPAQAFDEVAYYQQLHASPELSFQEAHTTICFP